MPRAALLTSQFNVFVDGGTKLLGLADVVMPNYEALSETVTGAGLMGEIEVPSRGHFTALQFTLNFRSLLDQPISLAVSMVHHFDLRSAQSYEDTTTFERGEAKERYSILGPVLRFDHGKRAPHSPWDAVIVVAVRRVEHYLDGKQVLEIDTLNEKYVHNGQDIYRDVRAAIGA